MTPIKALQRRLLFHGMLLFLLGLLNGLLVQRMTNPRMALAAHLDAVTSGTFLLVAGLSFTELRLSARQAAIAAWLLVVGMYVLWGSLFGAAALGTRILLPIAGSGFGAELWKEALVSAGIVSSSLSLVASCSLLLFGLRGSAATYCA